MKRNNQTEILAVAQAVAETVPGASVAVHKGEGSHRAIRITGALYPEEAQDLARRIADAIKVDQTSIAHGYGFCGVWWR